ncbi:peptide ABC transporter substrate-binding protein [Salipiger aestuarii]|uniref:Peptide/nickel transport system substrate-binding protein n=1 Tax=Salipiger aestuarii TaxID=568098 RepID=A0A327YM04_9RHOB|nr:ABC transporter substrate-binding protein [Salipiger aestuarii]KAB2543151.1 peptide ABC transporter substrate-binding protein [Salipiger aestuarii]RAK21472.1 peptide/nickel transport system substrate-binding protein [Salipiger aestuarii]
MSGFKRRRLIQTAFAAAVLGASGLAAAPARMGGTLKAGLTGASAADRWDSRTHMGNFIGAAAIAVFDTLTEIAADGSLRGELATAWTASPDARIWDVTLRDGVRFHDGGAFGARDVLASLALHRDDASGARPLVDTIASAERLTDHRIRFTLASGNADFPWLLADPALLIYPADRIPEAMARGIGTGLYRVDSFEPGRRFVGRRVETHYKDGQAGWFERVEFLAMSDGAARVSALRSGQVDAIDRVAPARAARLQDAPGLRLQRVAGNQYYGFAMQTGAAPFDVLHIRQALKHAIDRQGILDKVLLGHGRIGADSPIGPLNSYDAGLAAPAYDPDRAAHHLRKAGLSGLTVALGVSDMAFDGAPEAAALFADSARPAGIDIVATHDSSGDYWRETWRQAPFRATAWSGRVTEDWMFSTALQHGAPWNDTQWGMAQSPRFQMLLAEARSELDSARRAGIYAEMQHILRDEGGLLIPVFADHLSAVSDRIATPGTLGTARALDNARLAERWWRA